MSKRYSCVSLCFSRVGFHLGRGGISGGTGCSCHVNRQGRCHFGAGPGGLIRQGTAPGYAQVEIDTAGRQAVD